MPTNPISIYEPSTSFFPPHTPLKKDGTRTCVKLDVPHRKPPAIPHFTPNQLTESFRRRPLEIEDAYAKKEIEFCGSEYRIVLRGQPLPPVPIEGVKIGTRVWLKQHEPNLNPDANIGYIVIGLRLSRGTKAYIDVCPYRRTTATIVYSPTWPTFTMGISATLLSSEIIEVSSTTDSEECQVKEVEEPKRPHTGGGPLEHVRVYSLFAIRNTLYSVFASMIGACFSGTA